MITMITLITDQASLDLKPLTRNNMIIDMIMIVMMTDDYHDNQAPHSPPSDDLEPPAGLSFSALGQAPGEGLGYQVRLSHFRIVMMTIIVVMMIIIIVIVIILS